MIGKIKFIHIFSIPLFFVLLVAGCTATSAPATPGMPATRTPTIDGMSIRSTQRAGTVFAIQTSTETPMPSATRFPTDTPYPPTPTAAPTVPLSAKGPWLVSGGVRREFDDKTRFDFWDQNGPGHIFIDVHEPSYIHSYLCEGDNSGNYLVYLGGLYIFRPSQATGINLYNRWSDYTGDTKNGLLASIYQDSIIIFNIPSGTVRERIPLIKCPAQAKGCGNNSSLGGDIGGQQPKWSPNGRYLAFSAIMETMSSDLYVYDKENGSVRQLTNGPDWVGQFWWSPDGSRIVFEEVVMHWDDEYKQDEYFYLSGVTPSSIWAVSVSTNEIRRLDSIENYPGSNLVDWLDDTKFVIYDGMTMGVCCAVESGYDLRLIDLVSGEVKMLYEKEMYWATLNRDKEQVLVQGGAEGLFLISVKTGNLKHIDALYTPNWNKQLGLYVIEDQLCAEDAKKVQAFDVNGTFTCASIPTPTPTEMPRYPSPDGKSVLTVKDGLWLEGDGKTAVQVSREAAFNPIWCSDSSCFFFSVPRQNYQWWTLYRVSLPDLTVKMVGDGIRFLGSYQWLGATK